MRQSGKERVWEPSENPRFSESIESKPVLGFEARARGAMLGLAVGDALGTTLEFSRPSAPSFPQLAQGPHRHIIGAGPFGLLPGQVTDDTHMAACLAASLIARDGLDADEVAQRYVDWSAYAFDIGNQTSSALRAWREQGSGGRLVWEQQGQRPAGNGSLMRTAPLGVFYWDAPCERRRASLAESAITHFDPRCQLACSLLNTAIATAIEKDGHEGLVYLAVRNELEAATRLLSDEYPDLTVQIQAARDALGEDLRLAGEDDPQLYGPELHLHRDAGFVRVAFRLAFWELLHAPTFEEALIDVVNRGGDADTNAAITGALCGAIAGEEEIPQQWRATVLDALPEQAANPLTTTYHPRVLLGLVESMKAKVQLAPLP